MNVNGGKRVQVSLEGFEGLAGLTESGGKASLALPGAARGLRVGEIILVDDRRWIVEAVGPSQFVRGFKLAELRPAEGA